MKKDSRKIIIGLLVIIAILAGFIILNYFQGWQMAQQQIGYKQAILDMIQSSGNCSVVPLYVGNQTFNFIDISCLQSTG